MPFTAAQIAELQATTLETHLEKGTVYKQNIQNKPMLEAFEAKAGTFTGGKDYVTLRVAAGQGGGSLAGYSGDDAVGFYNPTGTKTIRFPWKEHHIGMGLTHTEFKQDGITVIENGASQSTSMQDGREDQALANLIDEKNEMMLEDFAVSKDSLLHGDGSSDAKAFAGIQSLVLASPAVGSTGGLSRVSASWWRNRAATAAFASAGGQAAITSSTSNGGALIAFLEKEYRQLKRYKGIGTTMRIFAGSDWISAYLSEIRANGSYSMVGYQGQGNVDGGMDAPKFKGIDITYDPTLDDLSLAKRSYWLDIGKKGIQLKYMNGERMKRHSPARPYDRYVSYQAITTTCVLTAWSLRGSAVYDIA